MLTMTVVWLALLHYYTGVSGFLAYLGIVVRRISFSVADIAFLVGLAVLLCCHLIIRTPADFAVDSRFFWGWVVFYFFFKTKSPSNEALLNVLVVLCTLTLVEAALINTVVSAHSLPNFPTADAFSHFAPVGRYQRPYSFGANATVGSSLLVALMAFCNVRGWRLWLSMVSVMAFVSGTGTVCLLILLLIRYRADLRRAAVPIGLLTVAWMVAFRHLIESVITMFGAKTGIAYLVYLRELKLEQIANVYRGARPSTFFIGLPSDRLADIGRGGDFGLLSLLAINGFVGLILLIFFMASRLNRRNRLPALLVFGASLHYPVMFFVPGQMIFGLLLGARETEEPSGQ